MMRRVLVLAVFLQGCAILPSQRVAREWQPRVASRTFTLDDAITMCGPPDRTAQLDAGGVVAEWTRTRDLVNPGEAFNAGYQRRPAQAAQRVDVLTLIFDSGHVLIGYRWSRMR